jgi:hypothetical protein
MILSLFSYALRLNANFISTNIFKYCWKAVKYGCGYMFPMQMEDCSKIHQWTGVHRSMVCQVTCFETSTLYTEQYSLLINSKDFKIKGAAHRTTYSIRKLVTILLRKRHRLEIGTPFRTTLYTFIQKTCVRYFGSKIPHVRRR